MTLSLCRAQEFYEAAQDHIRGKYFSWEEFLDSFMDEAGLIKYFSFWSGFNFPGDTYLKFFELFQDDLSKRERKVRETVDGQVNTASPFYVIGTLNGAEDTIRHELLHALFHVCPEYKRRAENLVESMESPLKDNISRKLSAMGYGENVIADEIQAYCSSGSREELFTRFGITEGDEARICPPFRTLAEEFLPRQGVASEAQ